MISLVRGALAATFLLFHTAVFTADYFPPPDSAGGWWTATNATQVRELAGMDLPRLEQAWEFTQRCTQNAGLLMVRNGWLVFEKYVGRASRNAKPGHGFDGQGLHEHRVRHHVAGVALENSQ